MISVLYFDSSSNLSSRVQSATPTFITFIGFRSFFFVYPDDMMMIWETGVFSRFVGLCYLNVASNAHKMQRAASSCVQIY